jgi:hypothetical protein
MGESAADVVTEIERIRRRMDADVLELRSKLPEPKRIGLVAAAGIAGLALMRWTVSRNRAGVLLPIAAGVVGGFLLAKRRGVGHGPVRVVAPPVG